MQHTPPPRPSLVTVGALALAFAWLPARAAEAQSVNLCVEDMSDEEIERHTARIVGELRSHRTRARVWRFGWLTAYTGIAVVALGVLAPNIGPSSDNRDDRARWLGYIGAGVGASVAAARLAFYPMPDVWGVRRIERMPTSTRRERIAQTQYAESVLTSAGAWQGLMTGSTSYVLALGWGIGWGTSLSRRYSNPTTAALAFFGSPILGIATALTAPNWAALSATRIRGGICGHAYVQDPEPDPLGDEGYDDDASAGEEDLDDAPSEADDLEASAYDPLDGAIATRRSPSVMVYPTLGGAGLLVSF
ncbi:MAG: hypothetical protein R3B40_26870 [Polyangiales bacterium]|nr:hypothetical protein [Myxococcales bacterium]MCB9660222.1 hypothetical protein [Sandaracinaceae bacterium]